MFIKVKYFFLIAIFNYLQYFFKDFFKNFLEIKNLSIIIPIFNAEKYLIECLNSVTNQTLKNIEIICIDDGSTDNSSKILQEYSKFDERFVIIKQKNQGSGNSRNKGIKISKGKYITFLDSDDLYFDNFALESLYKNAVKNNVLISGGGMLIKDLISNRTYINQNLFNNEGIISYKNYQYDFDYQRFIYNKNFIRNKKFFFPDYKRYQDPPFLIKVMFAAKNFYISKKIIYLYRLKTNFFSFNKKQVIDMFYGLEECIDFAEKNKLYNLYNILLNRLNSEMFLNNAKHFFEDNELKLIIYRIIGNINKDIIKKYNFEFNLTGLFSNYNFCKFKLNYTRNIFI